MARLKLYKKGKLWLVTATAIAGVMMSTSALADNVATNVSTTTNEPAVVTQVKTTNAAVKNHNNSTPQLPNKYHDGAPAMPPIYDNWKIPENVQGTGSFEVKKELGSYTDIYKKAKVLWPSEPQNPLNTDKTFLDGISGIDDGQNYVNNGAAVAVTKTDPENPNWGPIGELSNELAWENHNGINRLIDHAHNGRPVSVNHLDDDALFVNNEPSIDFSGSLTTDKIDKMSSIAEAYRPFVTFNDRLANGSQLTSIIQTNLTCSEGGVFWNFDHGWRGYTFENGRQLSIMDILKSSSLEGLRDAVYNVFWGHGWRQWDGFYTMYDAWSNPSFVNGPIPFYFTPKGVFVTVQPFATANWTVAVEIPKGLLEDKYQAYLDNDAFDDPIYSSETDDIADKWLKGTLTGNLGKAGAEKVGDIIDKTKSEATHMAIQIGVDAGKGAIDGLVNQAIDVGKFTQGLIADVFDSIKDEATALAKNKATIVTIFTAGSATVHLGIDAFKDYKAQGFAEKSNVFMDTLNDQAGLVVGTAQTALEYKGAQEGATLGSESGAAIGGAVGSLGAGVGAFPGAGAGAGAGSVIGGVLGFLASLNAAEVLGFVGSLIFAPIVAWALYKFVLTKRYVEGLGRTFKRGKAKK